MSKNILMTLGLISIFVGSWFLSHAYYGRNTIIKTVNLTDSEKLTIVQEARLNWIPADSANKLLTAVISKKKKADIRWIDSLRIAFRDSTRVKDTTIYNYVSVPVYEADSTFVLIVKDSIGNKATISQTLNNRFFPLQEVFLPSIKINSVQFNLFEPAPPKWYQRFELVLGLGVIGNNKFIGPGVFIGVGYPIHF